MRHLLRRFISISLALMLTAGLLQGGALAADCTHAELKNGVCQNESCKESFAAAVGDTLYASLDDALKAAKTEEADAVSVFTDLKDKTLELGGISLVVEAGDSLEFENCKFVGTNENQVLLNYGSLILKNVTVENTEGRFALVSECTEGTDLLELSIVGGSYTGKEYGIGLKQMKLQLNGAAEVVEEEELVTAPVVSGETADFLLEDSGIEVMCALKADAYTVENRTPGVFAFVPEYEEGVTPAKEWLKSVNAEVSYDAAAKHWSVPDSITAAIKVDKTTFTYNGLAQAPAVSEAKLYGKDLTADTDYTISFTKGAEAAEETVNVGKYKMTVSGKGSYSGTYEVEYEIVAATPVVEWDKPTEQLAYNGKAAALTSKAVVTLANDETFSGQLAYAYRAGSAGAFTDGLPVEPGTYEVKASVAAAANYTAAETEDLLTLTIGKKTAAQLTLEVTVPEGGHTYTGSEIRPAVTVKDGETVVSADEYEVTYSNNTNVGTATVTVKAKENGMYTFEDLHATFEIKKAAAASLTITGKPASVTYGDDAFKLSTNGGISGAEVTWTVTEGGSAVTVASDGTVTVNGAGKVKIKAAQSGNANYTDRSAELEFEVKPAALTVESVTAENRAYDGGKTVTIKSVVLKGIQGTDVVSVSVSGLKGELSDVKAGTYNQVTLPALTLTGADAANYIITQPTAAVKTNVTVSKAEVTTPPAEIKTTVAVDTVDLVVEKLGEGMPADAGKMTFATKNQDTSDGSEVIVLDWKVDQNGKLTSKLVPGKAGEQVIYDVTVSSENYKDTVVRVTVTLGVLTVDTSKVTVSLDHSELTYNGKEQKPTVSVKYGDTVLTNGTDYTVTYPADTTNAGEKELTVTFKGNYSGTAAAKYTIAKAKVSVSGVKAENKTYDGTTTASVSATLSGAVSGDDVKVTAVGIFANKNSGSNKSISVTYKLSGADAGNYELTSASGTTTATISPVTAASLNSQISGLALSNVDSGNKYALQTVINRANAALEDTGLSSAEKTAISNVKWSAEDMISRIESAAAAAATESIRKSANITKENVTLADKALLEKAQSDLNAALTSYSGNYTKGEETDLTNKKARIADALVVITRVQSAQTMIGALPAQITEDTVLDEAAQASVDDAKTAYDGLNDYEKSLLGEDAANKLTAAVNATGNGEPTTTPNQDQANTLISSSPEEGETFKFPTWILVVAVIAAGLCGGGLFIYKRKQDEDAYNW